MHAKLEQQQQSRERGSASARGYDYAWQQLRIAYLRQHPLCECEECGAGTYRVMAATTVDHIQPLALRPDLRLVWSNLRALSKPCHDLHTARTQAWGRVRGKPANLGPGR